MSKVIGAIDTKEKLQREIALLYDQVSKYQISSRVYSQKRKELERKLQYAPSMSEVEDPEYLVRLYKRVTLFTQSVPELLADLITDLGIESAMRDSNDTFWDLSVYLTNQIFVLPADIKELIKQQEAEQEG